MARARMNPSSYISMATSTANSMAPSYSQTTCINSHRPRATHRLLHEERWRSAARGPSHLGFRALGLAKWRLLGDQQSRVSPWTRALQGTGEPHHIRCIRRRIQRGVVDRSKSKAGLVWVDLAQRRRAWGSVKVHRSRITKDSPQTTGVHHINRSRALIIRPDPLGPTRLPPRTQRQQSR